MPPNFQLNYMSYAIDHKKLQSVQNSAYSDPEKTKESISEHLRYRQKLAIAILECTDETTHKTLNDVYDNVNRDILALLSIPL